MTAAGIDRIDWLKLDTQGTDLRLIESLGEPRFGTLMAVDAEPGVRPALRDRGARSDAERAW